MDCRLEPKIFKTHAEARSYWNTRAAPPEDVRSVVDEPVGVVDESDDGIFIELIYGENGNPLNRGDLVYRRPQCSEVSPQCSEHLRTQVTLLLPHTPLPHPPRHEGFLQPEREVPGYTIEQMKEYGALCAAEALRHNK
jgi:hypothetical protein